MRKQMFRHLVRHDTMVSVSQSARDAHLPPCHRGRSNIIYNGVEDPMVHAEHMPYEMEMRSELNIPPEAFLMCYTAEFIAWKDHLTLLRAFDRLNDEALNPHLLLIGSGMLQNEMRAFAKQMRLGHRVHFLSTRFDARRLLGVIDAYVHTSRGEAFGLAVVEAMLACKPVIVAADAVFKEYVEDEVSGLLFKVGDAQHLAALMTRVAVDKELASRLAINARLRCTERFAPSRFAAALCEVIEDAYHQIGPDLEDEMLEEMLGAR
jgi:glycosyltransferase involved in cell wall biosynthesis